MIRIVKNGGCGCLGESAPIRIDGPWCMLNNIQNMYENEEKIINQQFSQCLTSLKTGHNNKIGKQKI